MFAFLSFTIKYRCIYSRIKTITTTITYNNINTATKKLENNSNDNNEKKLDQHLTCVFINNKNTQNHKIYKINTFHLYTYHN